MYLNDKLPATETKADPFSLEALVAWLRTKPAHEKYDWYDIRGCVVCQFYQQALGIADPSSSPIEYEMPFADLATYQRVCGTLPWTFGAVLKRAEALL